MDLEELAGRAQSFKRLQETPGWQTLRTVYNDRAAKWQSKLGRDLLARNSTPADQRDIDWQAGFLAGAKWILDNPEKVGRDLESALRRKEHE